MKKEIAIVGGGAWGTALALAFADKCQVTLHKLPGAPALNDKRIRTAYDFQIKSEYAFLVVPSIALREVCSKLTVNTHSCALIICSKGIEASSGKLMSEIVKEFFPNHNIAVLSGPNLAQEVQCNLPTLTSIASPDINLAQAIARDCSGKNFKLIPSDNMLMIQLFGALKNVMAILCGAARGLELGENFIASLISACTKEIMEVARHKEPGFTDNQSLLEPAGLGDIFLTCASTESRNNNFGFECVTKYLGIHHRDFAQHTTIEGLNTIMAMQFLSVDSPLLRNFAFELIEGQCKTLESLRSRYIRLVLD